MLGGAAAALAAPSLAAATLARITEPDKRRASLGANAYRLVTAGVARDQSVIPVTAWKSTPQVTSWPADRPRPEVQFPGTLTEAFTRYRDWHIAYHNQLQVYSPTGDYLNYGRTLNQESDPRFRFNTDGIPLVLYGNQWSENPVTTMQYALTLHGRWSMGFIPPDPFLAIADHLARIQRNDGAFPYHFEFEHYLSHERFPAGWTSGMAQGVSLSVFARAFALTGSATYLAAGDRALACLVRGPAPGAPLQTLQDIHPSLSQYLWFEEYPCSQPFYTLNGFGYILLGLYDWSQVNDESGALTSNATAATYFTCGLASLQSILGLFDVGGMSAYDLGHYCLPGTPPNLQVQYHAFHISLLHALDSITASGTLEQWENRWRSAVD